MLEYTLCNELLAEEGKPLAEQARIAAELGYVGLELAPATLGAAPHRLSASEVATIRQTVEDAGLRVTGLHWLLSGYPEASITDPARQGAARDILAGLVDLCADLGGAVLIHGSPRQRLRPGGMEDAALIAFLADFFTPVARQAEARGVTYCIEPLSRAEDNTVNTVAEGLALAEAIASPAFRTMIDMSAAGQTEPPVSELIRRWVPGGQIGHIHANDTNRGAPGMGDDPHFDIIKALRDTGWDRPVGVEPFRCRVNASVTAAIGIATLKAYERAAQ
ncbi:sugar phosphate isomerase/epimerase family protein [Marinovum sp.]|uniref:sugar phosphate isomerase/epimerase family protein n=1 Tax=Marinovum sp. TaxID=2024839 RepID=UPI002B272447|nr:sugar phosphate isomerase/epimerase family protein [Marinovum sp.]